MARWFIADADPPVAALVASLLGGTVLRECGDIQNDTQLAIALDQVSGTSGGRGCGLEGGFERYAEIVARSGVVVPVAFYGWPHRAKAALDEDAPGLQELQACTGFDVGDRLICILDLGSHTVAKPLPCDTNELLVQLSMFVLERANHTLRHLYRPLRRPAVRVLLGALVARQIEWDVARALLCLLKEKEPYAEAIARQIQAYPHAVLERCNPLGSSLARGRYLLVDDEVTSECYVSTKRSVVRRCGNDHAPLRLALNDSGWGPVLAAVLRGTVTCCRSLEEGRKVLCQQHEGWDALFLDYNLGKSATISGGDCIADIKNLQFDLPIVIFTGSDEARIAKWCLTNGASGYYVKERGDSTGRNSRDAFLNLLELVKAQFRHDHWKRTLWRQYVGIEPRIEAFEYHFVGVRNQAILPSISRYLRHVSLSVFLDTQDPPVGCLRARATTQSSAAAVSLCNALTELCRCWWLANNAGQTFTDGMWTTMTSDVTQTANLVSFAGLRSQVVTPSLWSRLEAAAHAGCAVDLVTVLKCTGELLTLLKDCCPQDALTVSDRLYSDPAPALPQRSAEGVSHPVAAELGAAQMIDSLCKLVGMASPPRWPPQDPDAFINALNCARKRANQDGPAARWARAWGKCQVLFVDDSPSHASWDTIVHALFGRNSAAMTPGDITDLDAMCLARSVDLVLLDLKAPEAEDGLRCLELLRDRCPAVPVVMLTAGDDAYYTCRALQAGAANYFLKRHTVENADEAHIAQELVSLVVHLADRYGRCSFIRGQWLERNALGFLAGIAEALDLRRMLDRMMDAYEMCLEPIGDQLHVRPSSWLERGLHQACTTEFRACDRLGTMRPGVLALTLACGMIVERCVTIWPRGRTVGEAISSLGRLHDPTVQCARRIWKERTAVAHGRTYITEQGRRLDVLALQHPEEAVTRLMRVLREWSTRRPCQR